MFFVRFIAEMRRFSVFLIKLQKNTKIFAAVYCLPLE